MLEKLNDITTFIFDVDGVLTDGTALASDTGELLRVFNIKDGYAMQLAVKKGYQLCIISGSSGQAMQKRFAGLGIQDVYLAVGNKVSVYEKYIKEKGISPHQVLYMGDDIPDLAVMQLVGLATCPRDAVDEIKQVAHYISTHNGGKTAARDVIEKVLRTQGKWFDENPLAHDSGI